MGVQFLEQQIPGSSFQEAPLGREKKLSANSRVADSSHLLSQSVTGSNSRESARELMKEENTRFQSFNFQMECRIEHHPAWNIDVDVGSFVIACQAQLV